MARKSLEDKGTGNIAIHSHAEKEDIEQEYQNFIVSVSNFTVGQTQTQTQVRFKNDSNAAGLQHNALAVLNDRRCCPIGYIARQELLESAEALFHVLHVCLSGLPALKPFYCTEH